MPSIAIIPSTVGYHWEELFFPFQAFTQKGYTVDFYTPEGKPPQVDPNSVKQRPALSLMGLGVRDSFSPKSVLGEKLISMLETVHPISSLQADKYQAIYLPGGHGCLFDININTTVHEKIIQFYNQQKPIGIVCHATSCLAFTKINNIPIIKDRHVIGFLDAMDSILIKAGLVDKKFLPLPYWNEQKMLESGAKISFADKALAFLNPAYRVEDFPFITGVGPKAALGVAQRIIQLVEKDKPKKRRG